MTSREISNEALNKFLDNDLKKSFEKLIIHEDLNKNNIDNKKYVFHPSKIPDFVDIEILKEFIKKDIDHNKEYFDELKITYKISDPKKAEWMLYKSIKNSKLVGNGNNCIDICVDNKIGIDVCVLTLDGNETNEKSIIQNFSTSDDLDLLFKNNECDKAMEIFKDKLKNKCAFKNNIKDIYYLIFICNKQNIYLTCLKLNSENISDIKSLGLSQKCKSIIISNFIDNDIGNVRLYKAKKRLELRLYKNIINSEYTIKLF